MKETPSTTTTPTATTATVVPEMTPFSDMNSAASLDDSPRMASSSLTPAIIEDEDNQDQEEDVDEDDDDQSSAAAAAAAAAAADVPQLIQSDEDQSSSSEENGDDSTIESPPPSASGKAAASSSQDAKKKTKKVRFNKIYVYKHEITLGCNPAVTCGSPLEIQWKAFATQEHDLNLFEDMRCNYMPRRPVLCLRICQEERQILLLRAGVTLEDMEHAQVELKRIQASRDQVEFDWVQQVRRSKQQQQQGVAADKKQEPRREHIVPADTSPAAAGPLAPLASRMVPKESMDDLPKQELVVEPAEDQATVPSRRRSRPVEIKDDGDDADDDDDKDDPKPKSHRWKKSLIPGWRKKHEPEPEKQPARHINQSATKSSLSVKSKKGALSKKKKQQPRARQLGWNEIKNGFGL